LGIPGPRAAPAPERYVLRSHYVMVTRSLPGRLVLSGGFTVNDAHHRNLVVDQ